MNDLERMQKIMALAIKHLKHPTKNRKLTIIRREKMKAIMRLKKQSPQFPVG